MLRCVLRAALLVESRVELCAVLCERKKCTVRYELCGVLCCELPCLSCEEFLGAKIATALETATPLTYLEEQRELYLSFS